MLFRSVSDQIVRQNGTNPTDNVSIIKNNKIANRNKKSNQTFDKLSPGLRTRGFFIVRIFLSTNPSVIKDDTSLDKGRMQILNRELFGMTAGKRKEDNPNKKGNIRDYATIEQLIILANIESMNAKFIDM